MAAVGWTQIWWALVLFALFLLSASFLKLRAWTRGTKGAPLDFSPDRSAGRLPILVVGAGPTGLTVATVLASYGVPVRIVEKKARLSQTSKATNLMRRNQELMYALGLQERLEQVSGKMSRLMVHAYGKCFGPRTMHLNETPFQDVLLCGQHRVEHALADRLATLGVEVDFSVSVTGLHQHEDHVYVDFTNGGHSTREKYSYVVGCDGYAGVTREYTKLNFQPEKTGVAIRQVDCHLKWNRLSNTDQMWLFYFDHGFAAVIPLPKDTWRVLFVEPKAAFPSREPTLEEMQFKLREVSQDGTASLSRPQWFSYTDLTMGIGPGMVDGRIVLAGDVCNPILPNGGQGMNTGIGDAFNLAWKLAAIHQHGGPKSLLQTYEQERHELRSNLQKAQVNSLHYTTLSTPAIMQGIFRLLAEPILNAGGEYAMARVFSELSIDTRKSALSLEEVRSGGIKAGDRALDANVVHDSTPMKLYSIIYQGAWTLLAFTGVRVDHQGLSVTTSALDRTGRSGLRTFVVSSSAVVESRNTVLYDLDEEAHRVYEISKPTLILIRPDGYVGARVKAHIHGKLASYLDLWVPDASQGFRRDV